MVRQPAVTLYTSVNGQPINKIVRRTPDGRVTKGMVEHRQHYHAETVPVPDLAAFANLLRGMGGRPDQALSLSTFIDPPTQVWQTWSASRMGGFLGCDPRDKAKLAGWHDVGDDLPACCRIKENMAAGHWLLFDRDDAEGTSPDLADLEMNDWCRAVDALMPGFASAGKVVLPSTSTRVLVDGAPLASSSWHAFVLVDAPEAVPAAWAYAFERCAVTAFASSPWDDPVLLGFAKPRRSRASGEICGKQLWTIYDRSTWAVNRLVFDGCPTVEGSGLSLAAPDVRVLEGPVLGVSLVKPPSQKLLKEIREATRAITGHVLRPERTYGTTRDGRPTVTGTSYEIDDLLVSLEVDIGDGLITVQAFWDGDLDHVRCQTPYRDSSSFAAFLGKHKDGTPFLYDSGTNEKHVLDRAQLPRRMWEIVFDWVEGDYQPAFGYPDNSVFSRRLGRKIFTRDIFEDPVVIDRLAAASDAPCHAKGGLNRLALNTEFHKQLRVAWGALLRKLPSESLLIDEEAADTLPVQIGHLLKALVQTDDVTPWGHSRRALATWCHWYALQKPGHLNQVGSLEAWGLINADGSDFQIAITQALAKQVGASQHSEIAAMTKTKFTRRCNRYGITDPKPHIHASGRKIRGVILSKLYCAELGVATEHYKNFVGDAIVRATAGNGETDLPPMGGGNGHVHRVGKEGK